MVFSTLAFTVKIEATMQSSKAMALIFGRCKQRTDARVQDDASSSIARVHQRFCGE